MVWSCPFSSSNLKQKVPIPMACMPPPNSLDSTIRDRLEVLEAVDIAGHGGRVSTPILKESVSNLALDGLESSIL
jgi:hypothetical protein